MKTGKNQ